MKKPFKKKEKVIKKIDTDSTLMCPFCGGTDIFSGSWTPDKCINCGAVYYFGSWWEE